ncbi:MAG: hypothetical protein L6Q71_09215 [Planctomycetes bacterium]|nr:hypothetical protein [Planctomycetota bacterium]NUQ35509.1 hypothetical protein [Planctomycetaceae bacterium]
MKPSTIALLLAAIALSSCQAASEDEVETVNLDVEQAEQIPTDPDVDHIEFDIARVGNTLYLCWAQQRDGEATHDIYFTTGNAGTDLSGGAERVTNTTADSRNPRLAVNSDGDVAVVWEEGTSPSRSINMAERDAVTTNFGAASEVVDDSDDNENPHCHYDDLDTLHVVWDEGGDIFYRRRPDGGSMAATITLSSSAGTDAINATVTSDDTGNVYVAWRHTIAGGFLVITAAASDNNGQAGSFVILDQLAVPALSLGMYEPHIARASDDGQFYVAYRIGNSDERRIRVSKFTSFGVTLLFSRDVHTDSSSDPTGSSPHIVTRTESGTTQVYVAWEDDGEIKARASHDEGGSFGATATVSDAYSNSSSNAGPRIVAGEDEAFIVWDGADTTASSNRAGFLAEGEYETSS